ncbi:glycosyltransferase [Limosilactobacillus reuteri]|uniref:glycosyltransferase n=1 Tax=Limosilactobacillus reuteri TaxID=1598 RepID=UPI001F4D4DD6|nr:glycosyltransferase [Limosilactobacillus reuteri]MCH9394645.1 glycosyltransferase [Limosilactobacillus reuteri]
MMQNGYPLFSVLMSVYKNEKSEYLKQALSSIIDQSVKPNEILIVEDGPLPNELREVLNAYENNSRISVRRIKLSKNHGLGYALNIGVREAKNDLIARMDTDDISVHDRFELQLKAFMDDINLVLVGGQIDEFESNIGNIVSQKSMPCNSKEILKYAKYRNPFNHPTVMFKKKAVLNVGNYSNIKGFEDYDLWGRLVTNSNNYANLNKVLVHMRIGNGLYSRRGGIKYLIRYYHLRKRLKKLLLINNREMLLGDIFMTVNAIVPVRIRKILYKHLLRQS